MRVRSTAITVRNRQRADKPNEDHFTADDQNGLYLIADGVTTTPAAGDPYPDLAGGQMAARTFCDLAHTFLLAHISELCTSPVETMRMALIAANDAIRVLNLAHHRYAGANFADQDYYGTVAAMAAVLGDKLYLLAIGDVTVTLNRGTHLALITDVQTDNVRTYKQTMLERGLGARELTLAIRRDYRNRIHARGLGGEPVGYGVLTGEAGALDFVKDHTLPLEGGDRILLASDGLLPLITAATASEQEKQTLCQVLQSDPPTLEKLVAENERFESSPDDKTAILVAVSQ